MGNLLLRFFRLGPFGLFVVAILVFAAGYWLETGTQTHQETRAQVLAEGPPAVVNIEDFDAALTRPNIDGREVVLSSVTQGMSPQRLAMIVAALIMGFGAIKLMLGTKKPAPELPIETPIVATPAPAPTTQTLRVKPRTSKNAVPLWQQRLDGNANAFGEAKGSASDPLRSGLRPKRTFFGTLRKGLLGVVMAGFALIGASMLFGLDGSTSLMSMNTVETGSDGEPANMWGSLLNGLRDRVGGDVNIITTSETPTTDTLAEVETTTSDTGHAVMQSIVAQAIADVVVPVTPEEEMGRWDIDFAPVAQWFVAKASLAAMGDLEAQMVLAGIAFGVIFLLIAVRWFFMVRSALVRRQRTASIASMGL